MQFDSPSKTERETIGGVVAGLLRHPVDILLKRWNWKSALLSAVIRGMIFFLTNISSGFEAAAGAMIVEAAFYASIAGFYGALIESFRKARPAWAASLIVMTVLPAINHSLEFLLHTVSGTRNVWRGVLVSICFSMLSALFNLHAMRQGILIVGNGRQSLWGDLRQMPGVVIGFFIAIPRDLYRKLSFILLSSR